MSEIVSGILDANDPDLDVGGPTGMIWLLVRQAGGRVELPRDWADREEAAGQGLVKYESDDETLVLEAI